APPEPQAYPSSTTLGGAAGMAGAPVSPGSRRLPLVLGGVVVAGAAIAIAIVLATAGSGDAGSTGRAISYDEIAAGPRPEPAAAPPPAAPAPPAAAPAPPAAAPAPGSAAEPDIEMDPQATGSEVEVE